MYVGESERAVRSVFLRAKNSRPCVIFFDEVDSLAPRRNSSSGDGGSSSRVVNQVITLKLKLKKKPVENMDRVRLDMASH